MHVFPFIASAAHDYSATSCSSDEDLAVDWSALWRAEGLPFHNLNRFPAFLLFDPITGIDGLASRRIANGRFVRLRTTTKWDGRRSSFRNASYPEWSV
jgi:hypothetical protein